MELAKIVNQYQYQNEIPNNHFLPEQRKALSAITRCRTPDSGSMTLRCPCCGRKDRYCMSCGHRSCPKCQNFESTKWLERQRKKLLPVNYFLVTFTVPYQLRNLIGSNQKALYSLMFDCASSSLKELCQDPRFLGGKIGMTGVLHTHNRKLQFHPHIHFIVPAGALQKDKKRWITSGQTSGESRFLVPQAALASLFRGKLLAGLKEKKLYFSEKLYKLKWVVDCQHTGRGESALKYLSRYLYRGVISEKNILKNHNGFVTFSYIESKTGTRKERTLPGSEFLMLLLKHVLPKGFRRIRDYGLLHGNAKKTLKILQILLRAKMTDEVQIERPSFICPDCTAIMKIIMIGNRILDPIFQGRASPPLA